MNKSIHPSFSMSSQGTYSGHTVGFCCHSSEWSHQACWACWLVSLDGSEQPPGLSSLPYAFVSPSSSQLSLKGTLGIHVQSVAAARPVGLILADSLGKWDGIEDHPH